MAATIEVKNLNYYQILHFDGGSPVQNDKMQLKSFRTLILFNNLQKRLNIILLLGVIKLYEK
jgi:hypothetical protein